MLSDSFSEGTRLMAEETPSSLGTPEMITNEQRRRSLAGKVRSSNGGEKELPRYLRGSTGSCHDLCKYGRKHASEEKPWRLRSKKAVKKIPVEKNEALSSGMSSQMKKSSAVVVVKKRQVVDSDKCSHDDPEIIKREVAKSKSKPISSSGENPVEQRDSLQKKKTTMSIKLKCSTVPESKTLDDANTRKQKFLVKSHSARAISRSKETQPIVENVVSPMVKPTTGPIGVTDKDLKTQKNIGVSKVFAKKVSVSPRASFSPKASPRRAGNSSLRKSQSLRVSSFSSSNQIMLDVKNEDEAKQSDDYSVKEKTLHVIKMEDENSKEDVAEPSPPPSSSSTQKDEDHEEYDEYTVSEAEEYEYPSGSNEAETAEEEDMVFDKEKKPRQRKGMEVQAEGGDPRKLNFRRGRVLGEDSSRNGDGRRRFKPREDNNDAEDDNDEPTGEKVVLRHQDMQDKKDAQGLFNNVIEETASKLVETRKSKVKALVGAFETVISLQESKPSENSAT